MSERLRARFVGRSGGRHTASPSGDAGRAAQPSTSAPAKDPGLAIGVDIGGTKVMAAVVDGQGQVLRTVRRATPGRDVELVEDTITDVVLELSRDFDAVAVGIGAAGFVDAAQATVLFSPHLAWRREPLKEKLSARLNRPVLVDNDANAAAWAEYRFGAVQGESRMLCITLGTGIGGGIVMDGRLERGVNGMGGEFGHMVVVPGGHRCECGNRGCWEQYASGNALGREARELAAAGSPVAVDLLARAGGDITAIVGPLVTEAARDGDRVAVELLEDMGRWLGIGMANLAAALDPGAFVIGGGVSAAGDMFIDAARLAFARTLTGRGFRPMPRIELARLGPDAGVIGIADLARVELAGGS